MRFLNDVCAAGAGKLMVSATDKNLVYLVDLNDKSATQVKFDKAPKGPNGLAFITADKDAYLLVAEWGTDNQPNGSIRAYRLEESLLVAEDQEKPKDLQMKDGYMDGLAVIMKNGEPQSFLYSDWVGFRPGGKLIHCNTETDDPKNSLTELAIPNGPVAGPADFFYDPKTSTLVLPCMMDGRVLLMKLEDKE